MYSKIIIENYTALLTEKKKLMVSKNGDTKKILKKIEFF